MGIYVTQKVGAFLMVRGIRPNELEPLALNEMCNQPNPRSHHGNLKNAKYLSCSDDQLKFLVFKTLMVFS